MDGPFLDIITEESHKRLRLAGEQISIGRATTNVIAIDEEKASRAHCVLEKTAHGFRIRDLGSTNGTLVNGQRIDKLLLTSGDTISIGATKLVFLAELPKKKKKTNAGAGDGAGHVEQSVLKRRAAKAAAAAVSHDAEVLDDHDDDTGRHKLKDGEVDYFAASQRKRREEPEEKKGRFSFSKLRKKRGEEEQDAKPLGLDMTADAEAGDAAASPLNVTGDGRPAVVDDPEDALYNVIRAAGPCPIPETSIGLINNRGETVHGALADEELDEEEAALSIRVLRLLLLAAYRTGASDIHYEPRNQDTQMRMRVDGAMVEVARLDRDLARHVISVVKVLTDIDITQKSIVQEGHFSAGLHDREVDYRVSFTPAMHGQKLVIRVLDPRNAPQHLDELNLPAWMLTSIRATSERTSGMVLVCGPTGSGKTTTLYSVLRDVDASVRNVITIEDPVEYQLANVTQIPIDAQKGNTFHGLLRSVLRQDPDVILLGEVRDEETARTAMQASMTGHLVLSTVHAKDTIGTIFRLLDLGVEPYLVGSSLNLILAQRLMKTLCDNCKAPKKATPREIHKMGNKNRTLRQVYYPVGCPKCFGVGYRGRRGLFELLDVNDSVRDVILNTPTMASIRDALKRTVFTSLEEMGWDLVAQGLVSIEEVERVSVA